MILKYLFLLDNNNKKSNESQKNIKVEEKSSKSQIINLKSNIKLYRNLISNG